MLRGGCDGLGDHPRRDGRVDQLAAQVLQQAECLGGSWLGRASRGWPGRARGEPRDTSSRAAHRLRERAGPCLPRQLGRLRPVGDLSTIRGGTSPRISRRRVSRTGGRLRLMGTGGQRGRQHERSTNDDQGDRPDVGVPRRLLHRTAGHAGPQGHEWLDAGPRSARFLPGHPLGRRRHGLARADGLRRRRAVDQLGDHRGDVRGGRCLCHGPAHVRRRRGPLGRGAAVPRPGVRRHPPSPGRARTPGWHLLHLCHRRTRAGHRAGPGRRR